MMDQADDDFFSEPGHNLLAGLNPQQSQAVTLIDGPLMILAGPGSGKTRVVSHRIAYMIQQGISADRILALTFTNKAANELSQRIQRLVPGRFVWAGTFHKFCSRLLRQYAPLVGLRENFSILDMDDASKVFSQAWDEADLQDDFVSTSAVQQEISRAKNALIGPLEYQAGVDQPVGRVVEKVFPLYQQKLLACNAVDFDDLLLWIAVILQESEELRQQLDRRFAYIMVDEYQDTNLAQYAIVRSLSNLYPNLAVTGDPDQSIYGWRGANIGNILGFERDYPQVKVVRLEQNYRSTQSILRVADRLIVNNRQRKAKRLVPTLEVGQAVRVKVSSQPQDEARWIATEIRGILDERIWEPQDIAVFYRANWLSRNLEHEFNSAGIPYQLVNGFEFYQRKEVKDLVAYLRLLANPLNDIALERVINSPSRKIGKVTLDRIRDVARQRKIAMLEACQASLADARSLGRGAAAVATFVGQIAKLQQEPWESVRHLLEAVLRVTGYATVLEADRSETSSERLGNVNELLVAADEFDKQHVDDGGLEAYLESAALVSDTDKLEGDANRVKMMTMHAAKGLEFPCVYIIGLEEGILPHERSRENAHQIEEERRLFFVGITRAKQQLTLCQSEGRARRGQFTMSPASSFLVEIHGSDLDYLRPTRFAPPPKAWSDPGRRPAAGNTAPTRDWIADECGGTSFDVDSMENRRQPPPNWEDSLPDELANPDGDPPFAALEEEVDPAVATTAPQGVRRPSPAHKMKGPVLTTAAKLLAAERDGGRPRNAPGGGPESGDADDPAAARLYQVGGLVEHPEYGAGQVTDLSGPAHKQMVTVLFFSAGERKFRAKFCDLRAVGSPGK
jgi:DNA helicase-2/ATP-dependent DNA helicase PcrA